MKRTTSATRKFAAHRTAETGPLEQGRFQSFPIQEDEHLWMVPRYVERNPWRANLVAEAGAWRWSSLGHRAHGDEAGLLDEGPLPLPRRWLQHVRSPRREAEREALRRSVVRGSPFGDQCWQQRTARKLDLPSTLRPRGRPWKRSPEPK